MIIQWYGQSCFRLESKDLSLLIDPFSKEIGLKPPKVRDNIILITHNHFDHNNINGAAPETFIVNGPGEYESKGVYIKGIKSFHDKEKGNLRGLNTVYVIKIEDIDICHLGDYGEEKMTDEQIEKIGNCDILMVPTGGTYTIDSKEAGGIVRQIEPKIIIPMHYKIPGLKVNLEGPEKFLKEISLTPEKIDKFKITRKSLPTEEMKLVLFN